MEEVKTESQKPKFNRDAVIRHLLTKFRVCSRNQLAYMVFRKNTNPVNVTNRVMRRMYLDGSVLQVRREKDKPYLYTVNPAGIHHKSNKLAHCLKIVDFYIHVGCPELFVVEPVLGSYVPDILFKDKTGKSICVEVQVTPISHKKMQDKVDRFVKEYGKEHDSKILVICSDTSYSKVKMPAGFKLIRQGLPREVEV